MKYKFLDTSGVKFLWDKLTVLLNRKLESVTNYNSSIEVNSGREISVKLSSDEKNLLSVKQDGLHAAPPVLHKLTFGAGEEYIYDGTEDITVPVYDGTHDIKE